MLERIIVLSQADEIVRCAMDRQRRYAPLKPINPAPRKRSHSKRHSVNRERSREDAAKARRVRDRATANLAKRRLISATMADYFAGRIPDLKRIAHLF